MKNETLDGTWFERDRPVLCFIGKKMQEGSIQFVALELVRDSLGLSVPEMRSAIDNLSKASPPYVEVQLMLGGAEVVGGFAHRLTERGLREIGMWPNSEGLTEALLESLALAVDGLPDDAKRGKLEGAVKVLSAIGTDVLSGVVKKTMGLP